MLKRLGSMLAAAGAALFLAGCAAAHVSVNEVLQQPLGAAIYTRYNLFYSDPMAISSLNIQDGRILPLGTKVEIVRASERRLEFTDEAGNRYQIRFDPNHRLYGMRDFIKETFTLESPEEQLKAARPDALKYIMRGEIVPGMNRREVVFACGPPPGCMTPAAKTDTWIYWHAPEQTFRVVFRNNTVSNIINFND